MGDSCLPVKLHLFRPFPEKQDVFRSEKRRNSYSAKFKLKVVVYVEEQSKHETAKGFKVCKELPKGAKGSHGKGRKVPYQDIEDSC